MLLPDGAGEIIERNTTSCKLQMVFAPHRESIDIDVYTFNFIVKIAPILIMSLAK